MARALLLNASFEPLCVVSSRRAVVLVLKEKAEIVHRNGAEFRSERRSVPVPDRHPPRALRPRAVPGDRAAVAAGGVRPRRPPLPVLRDRGREPRSRAAAVARRPAHVGERRRVVPVVQRPQGSAPARRVRDGAAPATGRAARHHVADRVGRSDRSGVAPSTSGEPRPSRPDVSRRRRGSLSAPASRSSNTASSSRARCRSTRAFSRISAASRSAARRCCCRVLLGGLALAGRVLLGVFDDLHRVALRRLAFLGRVAYASSRCCAASRAQLRARRSASRSAAARSAAASSVARARSSDA